jgi:hypothetical protein
MFEIRKPDKNSIVVIRAASGHELSNYEKYKLANIEDNAQKNKIEIINVNGQRQQLNPETKEANIKLDGLITPKDLGEDIFEIKCTL